MDLTNNRLILCLMVSFLLLALLYQNHQKTQNQSLNVTKLGITVTVPDVDTSHEEGGFHLYFISPELKIKRLLSYRFDKNQTIRHEIDTNSRYLPYDDFLKAVPKMMVYSNSHNVYRVSKVTLYGQLSNGQTFEAQQQVDPHLNRNYQVGPIILNQMKF